MSAKVIEYLRKCLDYAERHPERIKGMVIIMANVDLDDPDRTGPMFAGSCEYGYKAILDSGLSWGLSEWANQFRRFESPQELWKDTNKWKSDLVVQQIEYDLTHQWGCVACPHLRFKSARGAKSHATRARKSDKEHGAMMAYASNGELVEVEPPAHEPIHRGV